MRIFYADERYGNNTSRYTLWRNMGQINFYDCRDCKKNKVINDDQLCKRCSDLRLKGQTIRPLCLKCGKNPVKETPNWIKEKYIRCMCCQSSWEVNEKKRLDYYKDKENKKDLTIKCVKCGNIFNSSDKKRKYCNSPCNYKTKSISEMDTFFREKKTEEKRKNNEGVAYSFFKKKYGIKNMIVRG